jgi:hypothetical protein
MLLRTLFLALSIMFVSLQANAQPPCQAYRLVTEEVTVPGTIQSECRVCITMPDGRRISVPVINGWLPEVKESNCQDGSIVRKLDYSAKIAYTGKNTNYVDSRTKQAQKAPYVTKQPAPATKVLPAPSRTDEVPPARMKKVEDEAPKGTKSLPAPRRTEVQPPIKMPVVPVRREEMPLQRKLSDIKEEPKITVVPRYDEEKE